VRRSESQNYFPVFILVLADVAQNLKKNRAGALLASVKVELIEPSYEHRTIRLRSELRYSISKYISHECSKVL